MIPAALIRGKQNTDNPAVKPHCLVLALVAVLFLAGPLLSAATAQCSMCGTVGNGPDDPLVKGMFKSILFMVSMPMLLVLSVGGWLFVNLRREADQSHTGEGQTRPVPFRRD